MKIRALFFAVAVLFLATASSVQAQQRFELTPFVGYETSGSFPVSGFSSNGSTTIPIDRLRANGGTAYGAFIDYSLTENFQPEFMWENNNTSYSARSVLTNSYFGAFHSNIDQFQFGGLYMLRNSEHVLRPYAAASVGFTHEFNNNGNADRTAFSWSVGGGVKYSVSRHLGFRGDIRYLPTYGSTSQGQYCDLFFGCYTANIHNYLHRGSFTGGLILKW